MEFRTVQYRGRQSLPQADLNLPDQSRTLENVSQYERGKLQNLQESLTLQNSLANRNNERLDQIAVEYQRQAISQTTARNQAALANAQRFGQQKLRNQQLEDDWTNQIYRLQSVQQAEKNQLKSQLNVQESQSLTQFGAALVNFSNTLWQEQANEINKKNQELQAQGVIDALLQPNYEGLFRQDQQQNATLAKNAELQLLADKLEQEGRPNEAANLRSANPFYLYGLQEGLTLKAAGGYSQFVEKAVELAHEQGLLRYGDTNYDAKLQALIQDQSRKFISANGLTGVKPAVLTKYFSDAFINGQVAITKKYNSQNNKVVKEEQLSAAFGTFNMAVPAISEDPTEGSKALDLLVANAGTNVVQALGEAFNMAAAYASSTGDRRALDNLMQDPRMQEFRDEYLKFDQQYQEKAAREAEKAQQDMAEAIWGGFLAQVNQEGFDIRGLNQVRSDYIAQAEAAGLPVAILGNLVNKLQGFGMNDVASARNTLDAIRANTPIDRLPQTLRDYANDMSNPPALREQAMRQAQEMSKSNAPEWIKIEMMEVEANIRSLIPTEIQTRANLYPDIRKQLDLTVKRRMEILDQRTKVWLNRPGVKNEETYLEWLKGSNQDILRRPIQLNEQGRVVEMEPKVQPASSTRPLAKVKFPNGREYVSFLAVQRDLAETNKYGRINIAQAVVMNPNQIVSWAEQYESGDGINPTLQKLAARLNTTPIQLLEDQAQKYGMRGGIKHPSNYQSTRHAQQGIPGGTRVTPEFARTFAIQAGMSNRGATWFVTSMMDESKGDASITHDQGKGLGLFGHQGVRRDRLIQFARARGKSPTDGLTQLQFAANEIKTEYPGIWEILKAPNPTRNQLWQAAKNWLRFDSKHDSRRQQSLFNVLGN
jgi:hypothetical protein